MTNDEIAIRFKYVRKKGRVTVAQLANRDKVDMRTAFLRLAEMQRAGHLTSEGGGRGEPIYWRAA
jgi:ribosomal protein S25